MIDEQRVNKWIWTSVRMSSAKIGHSTSLRCLTLFHALDTDCHTHHATNTTWPDHSFRTWLQHHPTRGVDVELLLWLIDMLGGDVSKCANAAWLLHGPAPQDVSVAYIMYQILLKRTMPAFSMIANHALSSDCPFDLSCAIDRRSQT